MAYVVHYRADDVHRTPGQCRTDHRMQPGELFYSQDGRAFVRSCRLDQSTDNTMQRNARALRILASGQTTKGKQ